VSEAGRVNFDQLLREARDEINSLKIMYPVLMGRIDSESGTPELKEWVTDVFADKVFASFAKIKQILQQLPVCSLSEIEYYVDTLTDTLTNMAHSNWNRHELESVYFPKIIDVMNNINIQVEHNFVRARKKLYESGWKELANVEPIEPIDTQRKKYVSARENLAKARKCLTENVEDVMMPLRSAIDLSMKERFGFTKIQPMKTFLKDADKYDFPLPAFNLIYNLFDEGSSRIHAGKGHTGFEAS